MTRKNLRKTQFLTNLPVSSIETGPDPIAGRCKFNFSYLDSNQGQDFGEWSNQQLVKLLKKIQFYSKSPLKHWMSQKIGGGNSVFVVYGKFPTNSGFNHPVHVPHEALWARFRLEADMRLAGFVIPDSHHDTVCSHSNLRFDKNTFYVVFLDQDHQFYLTQKK